tara:strand:- start:10908 stop:12482 length:1575 start_codon:yes stop_codon:yes gene_type:complete
MKVKNKKILAVYLVVFIFFMLITKIDFRTVEPQPYHSHDDASYYFHAYTLGIDFDLDYSNQLSENNRFYTTNNLISKPVPTHPIGSGVLSAPFIFFGNIIENLFFNDSNLRVIYFFYSMSAIFYFFISGYLLNKTFKNLGYKSISELNILYLLVGSGLPYFAFERFGMTHVYEVFGVSLVMYLSSILTTRSYFFIPFLSMLFLSIRWVNYFLFLIPVLILLSTNQSNIIKKLILKNKYYYLGFLSGSLIFLTHAYYLYGIISFNPGRINDYGVSPNNLIQDYLLSHGLTNLLSFHTLLEIVLDILRIVFSQEFGLFWFSPALFSIFYVMFKFALSKQFNLLISLGLILSIPLGAVVFWLTAASSYGYRYLFCLIPIGIFLIFTKLNRFEIKIFYILNILSVFLLLIFETNQRTSLTEQLNIFNEINCCSGRYYLQGAFESITNFSTILFIIGPSFISLIFIKIFITIYSKEKLYELLASQSFTGDDIERLLDYSGSISFIEILFLIVPISIYLYKIVKAHYDTS